MSLLNITMLENVIDPEILATMAMAELENALRAKEFMRVDKTLTGKAGSTVTIPVWKYTGMARDLPENEQGEIDIMETESQQFTVKKAVKNIGLTDESLNSGYGDPLGNAANDIRIAMDDKINYDGMQLLSEIDDTNGLVYNTANKLGYEEVVEALDLFREEEMNTGKYYLLINQKTLKNIRLDPAFYDRINLSFADGKGSSMFYTGAVGSISGCWVAISNDLPDTRSYILTPECLTVFLKSELNVETERQMLYKRTIVGSDCHYVVAITNYNKIVAINHGA